MMTIDWLHAGKTAMTWASANWAFLILAGLIFFQWVAFQALLIHYQLFRKSMKKPRTDGIRFSNIEKTLSFQAEQIELIFEKLASIKSEMADWARQEIKKGKPTKPATEEWKASPSVEASFVSLGEINLKRRLEAMKSAPSKEN